MKRPLDRVVDWFIACIGGTIVGLVYPCGRELLDREGEMGFLFLDFLVPATLVLYIVILHQFPHLTYEFVLRQ